MLVNRKKLYSKCYYPTNSYMVQNIGCKDGKKKKFDCLMETSSPSIASSLVLDALLFFLPHGGTGKKGVPPGPQSPLQEPIFVKRRWKGNGFQCRWGLSSPCAKRTMNDYIVEKSKPAQKICRLNIFVMEEILHTLQHAKYLFRRETGLFHFAHILSSQDIIHLFSQFLISI